MWDAWGGDAGFSWSRKIVAREKNMKKTILVDKDLIEEIKSILEDVVNPADTIVEIPDDEEITKALRPEVTREQMYAVIEHLQEAIEAMIDNEVEDESETEMPESEDEMEDVYKSENEDEDKWDNEMQKCWKGYVQRGMKEKNGRMVPNCVPVKKALAEDLQRFISEVQENYKNS
jgi:hypothetical protein